jgi:LysM repeat protein
MKEAMTQYSVRTQVSTRPTRVGVAAVRPTRATYIRRRIMVVMVLGLSLFGAVSLVAGQAQANDPKSASSTSNQSTKFTYITVHAGETLWSLASRYAGGADQREWIANLVDINMLQTDTLQPGQRLALPTL